MHTPSFEARFAHRFADTCAMGGGGGGSNPAAGATAPFGKAVGQVGTYLTDTSGKLGQEAQQAWDTTSPFISQELNTAFDPQQALYGRTLQQVTDQTRSGEAARGVADTPYGAAAEGNALSNFNIDWQNQQLGRETQGLGAATGAYSGLIGAGATAAQPAEAALQGYANAYSTSSQAQTQQNAQQQQASEFQSSQLTSLASSLGSLGKGGAT